MLASTHLDRMHSSLRDSAVLKVCATTSVSSRSKISAICSVSVAQGVAIKHGPMECLLGGQRSTWAAATQTTNCHSRHDHKLSLAMCPLLQQWHPSFLFGAPTIVTQAPISHDTGISVASLVLPRPPAEMCHSRNRALTNKDLENTIPFFVPHLAALKESKGNACHARAKHVSPEHRHHAAIT
eukprot:1158773-Pelagomonas_calceolata.AAC.22